MYVAEKQQLDFLYEWVGDMSLFGSLEVTQSTSYLVVGGQRVKLYVLPLMYNIYVLNMSSVRS